MYPNDTICAIATGSGGAVGMIRVSGPDAIIITNAIFRSKQCESLMEVKGFTIHRGEILDTKQQTIDDVLVSVFHSPHSYTGENATEISCHASRYVVQQIMQSLVQNGCRPAGPGEFTQRAYLNGKMDLSQAEAVADLIAAKSKNSHRIALNQLKGHFSSALADLRQQLLKMKSLIELELDFSDHEDLEFANRNKLIALAQKIDQYVLHLAQTFETGMAIKKGIPVAIVGKTNVGKSTLLNQLLHEDRAIVSDIHGTTRDVIEDMIDIQGITFRFIDTAGLRNTDNQVELIGIERTKKKIQEATIVLWITDTAPSPNETEEMNQLCQGKHLLLIANKTDLQPAHYGQLSIAAKQGINLDKLEQLLVDIANVPDISDEDTIIANTRHYEALLSAHKHLEEVLQSLHQQIPTDLVAESLNAVDHDLSQIVGGEITSQETLNTIFSHFCVGK